MPTTKTPKIRIPTAYRKYRELVAIPKEAYQLLKKRQRTESVAEDHVFRKRPLTLIQRELAAAHPDDPQLVADVIDGLKRSSIYAKRSTAAH